METGMYIFNVRNKDWHNEKVSFKVTHNRNNSTFTLSYWMNYDNIDERNKR